MKGWDCSFTETTVVKTEISATGLKIFHMNTPSRLPERNVFDEVAFSFETEGPKWHRSMRFIFVS